MDGITIISETCQEYAGIKYYLCGEYFQIDGVRLHRKIWEDNFGLIPKGFHVHHKDHDKSNNKIENLALILASEHISLHQKGHGRPLSELAIDEAAKWHKSEAGNMWHKQQYQKNKDRLHLKTEIKCEQCGQAAIVGATTKNRFCSPNCRATSRRKSRIDDEKRTCGICGAIYSANKYALSKTCSLKCRGALQSDTKLGRKSSTL